MASDLRTGSTAIHWFRKGLRTHDNPALIEACRSSQTLYPIFCIDPHFAKPDIVGVNRYKFLLDSLKDLDRNLRSVGSRLFVIRGRPEEQIPILVKKWNVNLLTFESDSEPYAKKRDSNIIDILRKQNVKISHHSSHTIHDLERYIATSKGTIPTTYASFQKLFGNRYSLILKFSIYSICRYTKRCPRSSRFIYNTTNFIIRFN